MIFSGKARVKELFDNPTSPRARGDGHDERATTLDTGGNIGQAGSSVHVGDASSARKPADESMSRARKGMLREATVVLQCILATVSEQEEAHEALVALLRLKDGDLCSRDAELEYLRQRLKERDAILQAVPTSGRLAVGGQGLVRCRWADSGPSLRVAAGGPSSTKGGWSWGGLTSPDTRLEIGFVHWLSLFVCDRPIKLRILRQKKSHIFR